MDVRPDPTSLPATLAGMTDDAGMMKPNPEPTMKADIYGGLDPRDIAAYSLVDAAWILGLPRTTLRDWVMGRHYPAVDGRRLARPLVSPRERDPLALSFNNIIELHVLSAIRRVHGVRMGQVRVALDHLEQRLGVQHPLLTERFLTDGIDLFVERAGEYMNVSKPGQLAFRSFLELYLERVERDEDGLASRLYPFTRPRPSTDRPAPKLVVVDPTLAFGRPAVAGTGVRVDVILDRFGAGDTIRDLADDYGISPDLIEEITRMGYTRAA